MELIVQKYGGTSVATVERIKAVAEHLNVTLRKKPQLKLVVVVSAMGDQTDELIELANQVCPNPPGRETDMLLSVGERITMALLAMALYDKGIDSVSLTGSQSGILTDANHGNARIQKILGDRIKHSLEKGKVVIVAGFQGMCPETKDITTLGRGGSDLTAIALASALRATRCEIYKDVDGVFTTDPRVVKSARKLDHMSMQNLLELTWSGAQVVHARGAHVAKKSKIPLEIRSSFNLETRGTLIVSEQSLEHLVLAAMTHKKAQALVTIAADKNGPALLSSLLQRLWEKGETPCVCQLTPAGLTVLVNRQYVGIIKELNQNVSTTIKDGLASVTLVGDGFWQSPETIKKVSEAVTAPLAYFESKNSAITLAIQEDDLPQTLNQLHEALF